jgi:hypothetical protein
MDCWNDEKLGKMCSCPACLKKFCDDKSQINEQINK